jgi:hypothetical protein
VTVTCVPGAQSGSGSSSGAQPPIIGDDAG